MFCKVAANSKEKLSQVFISERFQDNHIPRLGSATKIIVFSSTCQTPALQPLHIAMKMVHVPALRKLSFEGRNNPSKFSNGLESHETFIGHWLLWLLWTLVRVS